MRIAFLCYFVEGRISGPSSSVTSLAISLEKHSSIICDVYTTNNNEKTFFLNKVKIIPYNHFTKNVELYDVVILTGIYDLNIFFVSRFLKKKKIFYIVSLRSNIMKDSLFKGFFKKLFALMTYSGYIIKNAYSLHFLSEEELKNSLKVNKNYFISRNGTNIDFKKLVEFENREKIILFIGRIDIYHKGLDVLLSSILICQKIIRKYGWKVMLYGPSVGNGSNKIRKIIEKNSLFDIVSIHNSVFGDKKLKLLSKAMIFIHPSRYEGQPQALIEAMGYGCVPIVTPGTNMKEHFLREKLGWMCDIDRYSLAKAVNEAIISDELHIFSLACRNYVLNNFSWNIAAEEFLEGLKAFEKYKFMDKL